MPLSAASEDKKALPFSLAETVYCHTRLRLLRHGAGTHPLLDSAR